MDEAESLEESLPIGSEAREGFEESSRGDDSVATIEVIEIPADVREVLKVAALNSWEPCDDSDEGVEQEIARSGPVSFP